jgi:predicted ATPase/class 3 adenylate cyclase/DNA-binding CsgD family transcriptional regulator
MHSRTTPGKPVSYLVKHSGRAALGRRTAMDRPTSAEIVAGLPQGTVTFLFTDLEGSTQLWDQDPEAARLALAQHDGIIEALVTNHSGVVVRPRGEGDSRFAVFRSASSGVAAAYAIQKAFVAELWPTPTPLRVRIALHTGEASVREGDYYGQAVNRCARLRSIAHGGQTLLSRVTADIVRGQLPDHVELLDLGMHRLKDLSAAEQVFQLAHPTLLSDFPPLRSLSTHLHNLPVQLSSFVGREREVGHITDLLESHRHVTLTGTGGVGKTRLAVRVAAELVGDYSDGVWLVDLAPLSDPGLVPQAAADVLGIREQPDRSLAEKLTEHLRSKQLVLVLDNCEHVIEPCAELVEKLLRACPGIRILATSRERLAISGETVWRVPSLETPRTAEPSYEEIAACEAIRLFADRAQAIDARFQLTPSNAAAVTEICERLDGIPLALELAAAWVHVLSPTQLATRLSDCLRLLAPSRRTGPSRQQTLSATIQWSYDLLSLLERRLLARLSVFAGRFSLEAVEGVCSGDGISVSEVFRLLNRLVDQSLVVAEPAQGDSVRHRLLETIRQYARERLNDECDGRAIFVRHAGFYLAFAEQADAELRGPHQRDWLERIDSEHDNMRAALRWFGSTEQSENRLRLAIALTRFWRTRGYLTEGRGWLSAALSRCRNAAPDKRAHALNCLGNLATEQADWDTAESYRSESLRLFRELDDKVGIATVLNGLAFITRHRGDRIRAKLMYEEMLSIARQLDSTGLIAQGLTNMAQVDIELGEISRASKESEESIALHRQLGSREGLAYSLQRLARIAWHQGDYVALRARSEEALNIFRELGHKMGVAWILMYLGAGACETCDFPQARALLDESLALARELEADQRIAQTLEWLGAISFAEGDSSAAHNHLESGLAYARHIGGPPQIVHLTGRLAQVALAQRDARRACALLDESFRLLAEVTDRTCFPRPLERAAEVIAALGQPLRAARLFGAADSLRQSLSAPLAPVDKKHYSHAVATARAAAGRAAFEREWSAGALMTIDQAVAHGRETLEGLESQSTHILKKPPIERDHPDVLAPLTTREREVAELLVHGSTNREIATSLCIAPSTVQRHVANILTKLGIRSRTEVAVWAIQHNPEPAQ